MGNFAKYVFAIRNNAKTREIVIVPKDFWDRNHKLFTDYIPDNQMTFKMEDAGLIECMENTYSIENGMSNAEVIKFMQSNFSAVEDKDLYNFINNEV